MPVTGLHQQSPQVTQIIFFTLREAVLDAKTYSWQGHRSTNKCCNKNITKYQHKYQINSSLTSTNTSTSTSTKYDKYIETPETKPSRIAELHLAEMKQRWNLSQFSKLQMFSAFGWTCPFSFAEPAFGRWMAGCLEQQAWPSFGAHPQDTLISCLGKSDKPSLQLVLSLAPTWKSRQIQYFQHSAE